MEYIKTGSRIKYYRKLLGISQKELASNTLTKSMIYMLEKGNRKLTASTASLLVSKLNSIAEKKGIRCQISIKDLLMPDKDYAEFLCSKMISEAENQVFDVSKYENIIKIAKEYQLLDTAIELYEKVAHHYYINRNYESAKEFLEKSLELTLENNYAKCSINIGNKISTCYYMLQNYESAIEYCKKSYEQFCNHQPNDVETKNKILYNLTLYNFASKEYGEALDYANELLSLTGAAEHVKNETMILKANILLGMDKNEEALDIYKQVISNNLEYLYIVQHNMAITFKRLGKIEESVEFFNASIKSQLNSLSPETTFSLIALAEVYEKEKKYDESIIFYEYAMKNAFKFFQIDKLLDCYESVLNIMIGLKRISRFGYHNNCLTDLEKNIALNEEQKRRINLLHARYVEKN